MDQRDLNALFDRAYNGEKNFMTPHVIKRGYRKGLAYELSTGRGYGDEKIYGVTVLTPMGVQRKDLNGSFATLQQAKNHIKSITE